MFLAEPPVTEAVQAAYDADLTDQGYVANLTRLWSWRPDVNLAFLELRQTVLAGSTLTPTERALIVCGTARLLRDSYCSLAWGAELAAAVGAEAAGQFLLDGDGGPLGVRESALASWVAGVVQDPNGTTPADVDRLRAAGFDEREIFEATAFVAMRLAFSLVNDALGAAPDRQLVDAAPAPVRRAVTYGRTPAS